MDCWQRLIRYPSDEALPPEPVYHLDCPASPPPARYPVQRIVVEHRYQ